MCPRTRPSRPGEQYRHIRTEYVRERLHRTPWEERSLIDDLIAMEGLLIEGARTPARKETLIEWRWRYREEYRAIRQEIIDRRLAPRERLRELAGEDRALARAQVQQRRTAERLRRKEAALHQEELEAWTSQGGQPPAPEKENPEAIRYRRILTHFLHERLRETPWERHGYIDDLIHLERAAVSGFASFADAMRLQRLKRLYVREYEAICEEILARALASKEALERLEAERHERMERQRLEAQAAARHSRSEAERACQLRDEWLAMGGRP